MTTQSITVHTTVAAPIERVWSAYTTPEDIVQWNAASEDWHTPSASVDLREGGAFSSRMEAKDGSMGFDFAGTYTKIEPHRLIEYDFGDRHARVDFVPEAGAVRIASYNMSGQRIRTLVNGEGAAGRHAVTWDGRNDAGRDVASGTYLCRLEIDGFSSVRKLVLVR